MSSYRDDREALRARVDALESELHEVKSTAASQRADFERQLGRTAPPAPKSTAGWLLGGVALFLLLGAAAMMYASIRSPAPARPQVFLPAQPVRPPAPPAVVPPPTPAPSRHVATVRSASGMALPRGTRCTLEIDFSGTVQTVECGTRILYSLRLHGPGVDVFGTTERDAFETATTSGSTVTLTRRAPAMHVVLGFDDEL